MFGLISFLKCLSIIPDHCNLKNTRHSQSNSVEVNRLNSSIEFGNPIKSNSHTKNWTIKLNQTFVSFSRLELLQYNTWFFVFSRPRNNLCSSELIHRTIRRNPRIEFHWVWLRFDDIRTFGIQCDSVVISVFLGERCHARHAQGKVRS